MKKNIFLLLFIITNGFIIAQIQVDTFAIENDYRDTVFLAGIPHSSEKISNDKVYFKVYYQINMVFNVRNGEVDFSRIYDYKVDVIAIYYRNKEEFGESKRIYLGLDKQNDEEAQKTSGMDSLIIDYLIKEMRGKIDNIKIFKTSLMKYGKNRYAYSMVYPIKYYIESRSIFFKNLEKMNNRDT